VTAPVENLVQRLHAKPSGEGWLAKCPAHDDRTPSLSITEGDDGRVLLFCHAGCPTENVGFARVGDEDLFPADKSTALPFNPRPPQKQAEKPATADASYQPTDKERARWTKACDTLASDPELCAQLAKARGWKPETVRDLAVEGSLGYENGKLCFLYDTGMKVRYRSKGQRIIFWAFGEPWLWRGSFLAIASRTKVFLTEGETDAISLLDLGAESDPAKVESASARSGSHCCTLAHARFFAAFASFSTS
jgi:hypothetical protein